MLIGALKIWKILVFTIVVIMFHIAGYQSEAQISMKIWPQGNCKKIWHVLPWLIKLYCTFSLCAIAFRDNCNWNVPTTREHTVKLCKSSSSLQYSCLLYLIGRLSCCSFLPYTVLYGTFLYRWKILRYTYLQKMLLKCFVLEDTFTLFALLKI